MLQPRSHTHTRMKSCWWKPTTLPLRLSSLPLLAMVEAGIGNTLIIAGKLHSFPELWVMGTGGSPLLFSEASAKLCTLPGRPAPRERDCTSGRELVMVWCALFGLWVQRLWKQGRQVSKGPFAECWLVIRFLCISHISYRPHMYVCIPQNPNN